jgi:hypothetical protein
VGTDEEWKPIDGYPNYLVSNSGRIKSLNYRGHRGEKILSPGDDGLGYRQVGIWKNGKGKMVKVHRLVCMAFIPNPEDKPHINHKDGNKSNNVVSNLEWCTRSENLKHAWDTGLSENVKKALDKIHTASMTPIVAIDRRTGKKIIFPSVNEAARQLNVDAPKISACILGKRQSHKGYYFRRSDFE